MPELCKPPGSDCRSGAYNTAMFKPPMASLLPLLCFAVPLLHADDTVASDPSVQQASAYCASTGGQVYWRRATYGTNGPGALPLAAMRPFCQYTSATDGSRIHILLSTLYATQPTLAALAYYAQEQASGGGGGNPASYYCTQLGGSDLFGGVTAAGGGWVNNSSTDQTLEACIFPDMSSIDSWGLDYHSVNIIRGIDLSTVLRYANPYAVKK